MWEGPPLYLWPQNKHCFVFAPIFRVSAVMVHHSTSVPCKFVSSIVLQSEPELGAAPCDSDPATVWLPSDEPAMLWLSSVTGMLPCAN